MLGAVCMLPASCTPIQVVAHSELTLVPKALAQPCTPANASAASSDSYSPAPAQPLIAPPIMLPMPPSMEQPIPPSTAEPPIIALMEPIGPIGTPSPPIPATIEAEHPTSSPSPQPPLVAAPSLTHPGRSTPEPAAPAVAPPSCTPMESDENESGTDCSAGAHMFNVAEGSDHSGSLDAMESCYTSTWAMGVVNIYSIQEVTSGALHNHSAP